MWRIICIASVIVSICTSSALRAQESEPSLGDVAREARRAKLAEDSNSNQHVIDNDNFAAVLDEAEAAHFTGKPVFSIDPSGNAFRLTSPDGTCSLSFDAKATPLVTSSFVSTDLPLDELSKLEGQALIHDDVVEVSIHNGTPWEVREVVVGITVLQKQVPQEMNAIETKMVSDPSWTGKAPDLTAIYHLRGSAATNTSGTFTAVLGGQLSAAFNSNVDWHWALVSARGLPPTTLQSSAPPSAAVEPIHSDSAPGSTPPTGTFSGPH